MAKVASYLGDIGRRAQLTKVDLAITQMTDNPDLPDAGPLLAEARAAHDLALAKIEEVAKAEAGLKALRGERDEALAKTRTLYATLGNFAVSRTRGAPAKLTGCGFKLTGVERRKHEMPRVEKLAAFTGEREGTVRAKWKPIRNAKSYVVQVAATPSEESWRHYQTVTRASLVLEELKSGQKIWVRVCAINGNGRGAWSDPACAMVP